MHCSSSCRLVSFSRPYWTCVWEITMQIYSDVRKSRVLDLLKRLKHFWKIHEGNGNVSYIIWSFISLKLNIKTFNVLYIVYHHYNVFVFKKKGQISRMFLHVPDKIETPFKSKILKCLVKTLWNQLMEEGWKIPEGQSNSQFMETCTKDEPESSMLVFLLFRFCC